MNSDSAKKDAISKSLKNMLLTINLGSHNIN